jgi:hypothetical protein
MTDQQPLDPDAIHKRLAAVKGIPGDHTTCWRIGTHDAPALLAEVECQQAEIVRLNNLVDGLDMVREAAERWASRHPDIQEALDLHASDVAEADR